MEKLFYIATNLMIIFMICTDATWIRFDRMESRDGEICNGTEVAFSRESVKDKSVCLFECKQDINCSSVFHIEETGICMGCNIAYNLTETPTGLAAGSVYYYRHPKCPEGWFNIKDSCYFITEAMTFDGGVGKCQSLSSHPVVIDTEEENTSIKAKLKSLTLSEPNAGFYTAFTDTATEGTWIVDGTTIQPSFYDWGPDEPNGGTYENCLIFVNHLDMQWGDLNCNVHCKTVCEKAALN